MPLFNPQDPMQGQQPIFAPPQQQMQAPPVPQQQAPQEPHGMNRLNFAMNMFLSSKEGREIRDAMLENDPHLKTAIDKLTEHHEKAMKHFDQKLALDEYQSLIPKVMTPPKAPPVPPTAPPVA